MDSNGVLMTPRNSEALLEMLHTQTGGDPDGVSRMPLSTLNELSRHVATISKKKAPQLAVQKRGFVKNYYEDLNQVHGGGGGGGGGGKGGGKNGGGGGGGAPLSAEGVFREVEQRLTQARRSVTGTGELNDVHIDGLADKISSLLGQKVPVQKHERRNLILQWHRHVQQQIR